ncbi:MAG: glycine betaine ABC transporter substrate-binding protein [Acidobacteriota bacterium]|nr:ABC transporter substrate-binding protein [Blastocatellia bacterium]MDW8238720.1 glycine betaine ABC transporter substrate-binding protein [Acidobacteriota bacterium]
MKTELAPQTSSLNRRASPHRPATTSERQLNWLPALSGWLLLTGLWILLLSHCAGREERIVIGSKNFTEQVILGELLAQHIETNTGLAVMRRLNLGGTFICHQAIRAGDIDLYVEYTGTALTAILKQQPTSDAAEVYRRVKQEYAEQFQLEWMQPLGFNNTFAMIVRGEDARALNIRTISQAAEHTPRWRAGFGPEFMERADGYNGLAKTYGLKFAQPPRIMDLGLMYRALIERQVDIVAGNSTDGLIASLDLVVLEDDRHYFPPYEAAPVVRRQTLERHPALRQALHQLGGCISAEQMRQLNYQVDGRQRDVRQVVQEFRQTACR